jgi:hypothetical protein
MALEEQHHKVILPIWHEVDEEYVKQRSPILAGRFASLSSKGTPEVVNDIRHAVDGFEPHVASKHLLLPGNSRGNLRPV